MVDGELSDRNGVAIMFARHESDRKSMGLVACAVYANGRQFDYVEDLRDARLHTWDNISLECLQNIATSMPRCLIELVEKCGGATSY